MLGRQRCHIVGVVNDRQASQGVEPRISVMDALIFTQDFIDR